MKKVRYGLAAVVAVALLLGCWGFARADVECPPTDTAQPPATETPAPPTEQTPPTETFIPPTLWEPTPSSPPEETRPPVVVEDTPTPTGVDTPTPGVTPDPTATETPGAGKHPRATPTWDCNKNHDDRYCIPRTGRGDDLPPNVKLGGTAALMVALLGVAFLARRGRHAAG